MIKRLTMKFISKKSHRILCLSVARNTKRTEQTKLSRKSKNLNDVMLGLYLSSCVAGYSVIAIGYPPAVLENRNRGVYDMVSV